MGIFRNEEGGEREFAGREDCVAFYWNGSAPMAHPVSDVSADGFYLHTEDKWHLGTMLTLTLQGLHEVPNVATPRHLVVLGKVIRQDGGGAYFEFVPVIGEKLGASVRPASKRQIVQFLKAMRMGHSMGQWVPGSERGERG